MHPQLEAVAREYRRASDRLDRLVQDLSDDEWSWRPEADRWSVGENVAHLNITSDAMVPPLRAAIEEARSGGARGPRRYRRDPVGWLFSQLVGPLPRIARRRWGRVKTPPAFVPGGDLSRDVVMERFREYQAEQLRLLEQADGLPLQRMKIPSPFVERVSYNAYAAFIILVRHQHRHLQQAEEAAGRLIG